MDGVIQYNYLTILQKYWTNPHAFFSKKNVWRIIHYVSQQQGF